MKADRILLAHGSGGKLMHDLVKEVFLHKFSNPTLAELSDAARVDFPGSRLAFTTDTYVVNPIFFPGGDIGRLAVCGTVNDLAMSGATPLFLSVGFVLEEGLPLSDLDRILDSMVESAAEAGVKIITGDTKVVEKGSADTMFINTAGVGMIPEGLDIAAANARPGDTVILSGGLGEHGIAVVSKRQGVEFETPVLSDCAPLGGLVADMLGATEGGVRCLRDPTRGGLASTLNEFADQSCVAISIEEGAIPIKDDVFSACEMLGYDPFHVANEGKLVAVVAPDDAEAVLSVMKQNRYGADAAIIGEVLAEPAGKVLVKTTIGATRILDMLVGEQLPRIC